ncbi:MAG: hypothetical protein WBC71_05590, partial [Salaquimonas sp.]
PHDCTIWHCSTAFSALVKTGEQHHFSVVNKKKKGNLMTISLISRIFPRAKSRKTIEMEYLNKSVSMHDLERRQWEIGNGLFR